jgi:hypothetical protein
MRRQPKPAAANRSEHRIAEDQPMNPKIPTIPADAITAESIAKMMIDNIGPALDAMLAKVSAAEVAYGTTPSIRDGFDHREAEDGIASLRHYLDHAVRETQRIVRAKR